MRPVDRLIAGYLVFMTIVIVARGDLRDFAIWWLMLAHALVAALIVLGTRLRAEHRFGHAIYTLYPIILTPGLYTELGILSLQNDVAATFAHDAIVQRWEEALFARQISYEWIRAAPSVFWSSILHLAYFTYYPMVVLGPVLLLVRGKHDRARQVVLATMIAFVACYVIFVLFPVAGPNYAFAHPTGPVREVWSARLVYGVLAGGSAFGTAFPSSHVAATVAVTLALWYHWRIVAWIYVVPATLLLVGTVYCQMHYGVDALTGLALGAAAGWVGSHVRA